MKKGKATSVLGVVLLSVLLAAGVWYGIAADGVQGNRDMKDWGAETGDESFTGKILEMNGDSVLVEPLEGEDIRRSADQIVFGISELEELDVNVGDIVEVTYTGSVMESYPAQIVAVAWEIVE